MKFFLIGITMLILALIISSPAMAESVGLTGSELKTMTVIEVAKVYQIDATNFAEKVGERLGVKVKTSDSFQLLHDNYGAEPSVMKDIALGLQTGNTEDTTALTETSNEAETKAVKAEKEYNFFPITIFLLILYLVSFVLSRKKIISYALHKKIWNWLLLGFFLASAILGSLLALRISNGIILPLPFNMLYWHVEAGIAMTAISIFHIVWHWRYFVSAFKKAKTAQA